MNATEISPARLVADTDVAGEEAVMVRIAEAEPDSVIGTVAETNLRTVEGLFAAVATRDLPAILGCYADSLSMALLVVLETLSPLERARSSSARTPTSTP